MDHYVTEEASFSTYAGAAIFQQKGPHSSYKQKDDLYYNSVQVTYKQKQVYHRASKSSFQVQQNNIQYLMDRKGNINFD